MFMLRNTSAVSWHNANDISDGRLWRDNELVIDIRCIDYRAGVTQIGGGHITSSDDAQPRAGQSSVNENSAHAAWSSLQDLRDALGCRLQV